mmetsp:Transcript_14434/g.46649  ORF Transcript_14434/g.46649 Transcript_14434/m.46649 type:complete len:85 (+) Transcript_14434:413-667(+)
MNVWLAPAFSPSRGPTSHLMVQALMVGCRYPSQRKFLRLFPSEGLILATEVSIDGSLLHDWASQLQVPNNTARAQVKVRFDDFN